MAIFLLRKIRFKKKSWPCLSSTGTGTRRAPDSFTQAGTPSVFAGPGGLSAKKLVKFLNAALGKISAPVQPEGLRRWAVTVTVPARRPSLSLTA